MLTLRKCSWLNKIKNRYIITMVYKSKKINKRRYFKRQSRKFIKKGMYGGDLPKSSYNNGIENQEKAIDLNNKKKDEIASEQIMNQIEENNKLELPNLTELPVAGPIIKSSGNLIENAAVKGLDVIGDSIGIDIENPESIGEKLDDIKDAVSSPENIEKTKQILANAGEYVGLVVEAASPVIEKTSEKVLPVVMKEADKAIDSIAATGINLLEDVTGPLIGVPRTLWTAAEAFNASVNAGSQLIKGTAEAIQGTQANLNRLMDEGTSKISNVKLPDAPKIPNLPQIPKTSNMDNISYRQQGGGLLKKYQKEKMMIGGRISQSQSEFLGGKLNSSRKLHQSGGKWHTKRRHYLKRKMTSRSYK